MADERRDEELLEEARNAEIPNPEIRQRRKNIPNAQQTSGVEAIPSTSRVTPPLPPPTTSPDELNNNSQNEAKLNLSTPGPGPQTTEPKPMTREEYTKSLNQWIYQCYYWQSFNAHAFNSSYLLATGATMMGGPVPSQTPTNTSQPQTNVGQTPTIGTGITYLIPKLWKRAAAEVLDFFILLFVKVLITYVAMDFDLIDLSKFDLNLLETETDAYQMALELTSEIIVVEMIHRLVVIVFETLCLRGDGDIGGSTPGKRIMHLKVISCTSMTELGDGRIQVLPGKGIGFLMSLFRTVIKNMSSIFFLPASLTVLLNNHNRAVYDLVCRCVVVEEIHTGRN